MTFSLMRPGLYQLYIFNLYNIPSIQILIGYELRLEIKLLYWEPVCLIPTNHTHSFILPMRLRVCIFDHIIIECVEKYAPYCVHNTRHTVESWPRVVLCHCSDDFEWSMGGKEVVSLYIVKWNLNRNSNVAHYSYRVSLTYIGTYPT